MSIEKSKRRVLSQKVEDSVYFKNMIRLLTSEDGAEITELGVMLAFIVALSLPLLISIGAKVLASYTVFNAAVPN